MTLGVSIIVSATILHHNQLEWFLLQNQLFLINKQKPQFFYFILFFLISVLQGSPFSLITTISYSAQISRATQLLNFHSRYPRAGKTVTKTRCRAGVALDISRCIGAVYSSTSQSFWSAFWESTSKPELKLFGVLAAEGMEDWVHRDALRKVVCMCGVKH